MGSGYFASRGKIAPCYFAIWRQNSLNAYFATNVKIALSLMLTLTQTLTLIPTLALTQTEEKHYFASRGKIATSILIPLDHISPLFKAIFKITIFVGVTLITHLTSSALIYYHLIFLYQLIITLCG